MHEMLKKAYTAWLAGDSLRRSRARHKRYTYGDQWSDIVTDNRGNTYVERDLIIKNGKRPLTNNLIRRLVKAIVGRYRNQMAENGVYDTTEGSFDERNSLCELDCRMLEEFVISGCAIQRISPRRYGGVKALWVDNVSPDTFFVNDFRDPRGHDIDVIGMLHDMSVGEAVNTFGHGNNKRMRELKKRFEQGPGDAYLFPGTAAGTEFTRARTDRIRFIEVWGQEMRPASGKDRHLGSVWKCWWFTTDGFLVDHYESPFGHGSHPFVLKFYPLTDGEVHSFVEDLVGQQNTVNRLMVLIDSMLASSAKGALLFPRNQLVKGMTIEDVGRMWSHPDSVIPINGMGNEFPQQMVTRTSDSGAYELLNMQMRLMDEISGIGDALLGRNISAAMGTAVYEAQVRNASIALADLLETFIAFTRERWRKAKAMM